MRKILVTGGTVFVSRFIAEHYVAKGDEVYVLNRNTRPQSAAVKLIQADRHAIGDALQGLHFDLVIDTAYTREDMRRHHLRKKHSLQKMCTGVYMEQIK